MARRASKTILIVLLVISALIGMSAIGISYYYSQVKDVTPTDTSADEDVPACNRIYLKDEENNIEVSSINQDSNVLLISGSTILVGSEFQLPTGTSGSQISAYTDFRFTINNETFDVKPEDYETTNSATLKYYFPEVEYTIPEGATSVTVQIVPIQEGSTLSGYTPCNPLIVSIQADTNPPSSLCVGLGEEGSDANQQCCAGLSEVTCEEPDPDDLTQCILPSGTPSSCFRCVTSNSDNMCEEGENYCNSIDDCSDPGDGDNGGGDDDDGNGGNSCISLGQQGITSGEPDAPTCCEGLNAISCSYSTPTDPQCIDGANGCFTCVTSDEDNLCGSGENICNSPEDCADEDDDDGNNGGGGDDDDDDDDDNGSNGNQGNSNFTVSLSGPACLDRVSGSNQGSFRIVVRNNGTSPQDLMKIVGSAPLGYTYSTGSTIINGVAASDNQYLAIINVGSSQQLTWSNGAGWTIEPGGSLTLELNLIAGPAALTNQNALFEVVATPENIPTNANTLRASYQFRTAQNCKVPETGLFDTTASKITVGLFVMLLSGLFYITQLGEKITVRVIDSPLANKVGEMNMKRRNPRGYFESKLTKKK